MLSEIKNKIFVIDEKEGKSAVKQKVYKKIK